jgi:neutral ceramidase
MRDARLYISETEVTEANINRSPSAYDNNPEEEKAQYQYNVDKSVVQLRMVDANGDLFGAINWFAVHPTSMNNTNRLVTTDNLGLASIMLEKEVNENHMAGYGAFVGAFASTNLGDVSPNIMGPKCEYTGLPCDLLTSSCPQGDGMCFASGPGKDMFDSTEIIATRIYRGASVRFFF